MVCLQKLDGPSQQTSLERLDAFSEGEDEGRQPRGIV